MSKERLKVFVPFILLGLIILIVGIILHSTRVIGIGAGIAVAELVVLVAFSPTGTYGRSR
jgi:hypothetical protein